jgi:hypothetical protein
MDASQPISAASDDTRWWKIALLLFLAVLCLLVLGWMACIGSFSLIVEKNSADATATTDEMIKVATATASARATAYTEYALTDTFDSNENGWRVGKVESEFWTGSMNIEDGAYAWDFQKINGIFLDYSDYSNSVVVRDFDAYVDTKIIDGDFGSCSGILFRKSPYGWVHGGYAISVCKNGQFVVGYLDENSNWDYLTDWVLSPAINKTDWNRIEVSARGDHFIFRINDFVVFETDDTHQLRGDVALFVESHSTIPMMVMFDNFDFQNK